MENAERNRRIIAMVKAGATYSEAGAAQGCTRNAVAGVCRRNGVIARSDQEALARRVAILAEANAKNARKRAALIKKLHADPAWKIRWQEKLRAAGDVRWGRNSLSRPQI